ncbi:MAG: hypothetical protein ACJATI_002513 [Halioglobus sp.]|jgi:hypothetical protein
MKNLYLFIFLFSMLSSFGLKSQDIIQNYSLENRITNHVNHTSDYVSHNQPPKLTPSSTISCEQDTLQYGRAKADLTDGMLAGVGLSGPFTAAGQLFEVPGGASVEVTGFALFASIISADAPVRCAIYEADMSGLPIGEALAMTDIIVTATDSISNINFDTPATMTTDFVITTELMSANPLAVRTNNGNMGAGKGEKLALLLFQGNWVVAETAGPPGAFNFDFIMEPFVNYDITAGMTTDAQNNTVFADSSYTFIADHSSLVSSRFFNRIAFDQFFSGGTISSTTWDFGGGSTIVSGDEISQVFSDAAGNYTVKTTATIEGYTTSCEDILETTLTILTPSAFSCGQDTLQYGRAKADLTDGMLAGVGLSGPFTAAGQLFEVPEGASVEVTGFALFASIISADAPVRCAIYEADMSGLPIGEALAMTDITVTATDTISYINFDTPVTMATDFVITTELLSAAPLAVRTNNGNMGAGQGEKLALLLFQGNWVVAETAGPPGAFNFDFIMEPFVNYDITAGMTTDAQNNIVFADSSYTFNADHSPLVGSRFFNKVAFDQFFSGSTNSSTTWDFGDGTSVESGDTTSHIFSDNESSYTVMTTAKIEGYTTSCEDIIETTFDVDIVNNTIDNLLESPVSISPNPSFGYSQIHLDLILASDVNIAIYNLMGQRIKTYSLKNINESTFEIDLSYQDAGLYIVEVEIEGRTLIEKLIIQ